MKAFRFLIATGVLGGVDAAGQVPLAPPPALFEEPGSGMIAANEGAVPRDGIVRHKLVSVSSDAILRLEGGELGRTSVTAFDGATHAVEWTAREDFAPGRFSLTGVIERAPLSRAVVSVWDGAVALSLHLHGENEVRLRQAGGGAHWLEEVDGRVPCVCGGGDDTTPGDGRIFARPLEPSESEDKVGTMGADGNSWIDILCCYTPQARDAAGGHAEIASTIVSRLATLNSVHATSGTLTRFRMMGILFLDEAESGYIDTDRIRLGTADDGYFDAALASQNSVGADLVHLFVDEQGTSKGEKSVIGQADLPGRYGVTKWDSDPLVFAHEVGHNLGCRHQVANDPDGTIEHAYQATYDWYDPVFGGFLYTSRAESVMWATISSTMVGKFSHDGAMFTFNDILLGSETVPFGAPNASNEAFIRQNRATPQGHSVPAFFGTAGAGTGQATTTSPSGSLSAIYTDWYQNTGAQSSQQVKVALSAGHFPAPIQITKKSRIEKWKGSGNVRIGP